MEDSQSDAAGSAQNASRRWCLHPLLPFALFFVLTMIAFLYGHFRRMYLGIERVEDKTELHLISKREQPIGAYLIKKHAKIRVNRHGDIIEVDASHRDFNDDDLRIVSQLSQMKKLFFIGTEVTDKGLIHLQNVNSLELIWAHSTGVTSKGEKWLEDRLPNCDLRIAL